MITGIQIKTATQNDAQFISLLGRITFTETFGSLFKDAENLSNYLAKTFSIEKISQSISKSNNIFWLALVDELPVGYAKLKVNSPSEFYLDKEISQLQKIYVLKDFLSMKVGKRLQGAMIEKVKELKRNAIWLSVLHSNERAIRFYQKSDFFEIGKHDFQIGSQTFEFIAMAKKIHNES